MIGENHIVNVRTVSKRVDDLPDGEKARICNLNDKITDMLCEGKISPEHHLLAVEALLISVKFSLTKLGYIKKKRS